MRLRRIMFNAAAVLSSILCLATSALTIRSFWISNRLCWCDNPRDLSYFDNVIICTSRGGAELLTVYGHWVYFAGHLRTGTYLEWMSQRAVEYPVMHLTTAPLMDDVISIHGFTAMGFEAKREIMTDFDTSYLRHRRTSVTIPLPFIAVLFSLLPIRWALCASRGRAAKGLCAHCGYDLRATPDRCPECGTRMERLTG
jgi:hypothetical protein